MSQYTSTQTTTDGTVINAVLDTVTNQTTYTVTSKSGMTVTQTVPNGTAPAATGVANSSYNAGLRVSLGGAYVDLSAVQAAVAATTADVTQQQQTATAAATATGNPPPAEAQAIPVPDASDPTPTPLPPAATPTAPAPTDATVQTNNSILAAITGNPDTTTTVDNGSDPYVSNGASTIEPVPVEAPEFTSGSYVSMIGAISGTPQASPADIDDGSDPYVSNGDSTIAAATPAVPTPPVAPVSANTNQGTQGATANAKNQATNQDQANALAQVDWRVRLALAPGANYLYAGDNPGILTPLIATEGVLFPYTPSISVSYAAGYDPTELTHSNYKIFQYKSSSVDNVSITCDFTAQDTTEANYLLAVIHFFRSVTKMFYGQDQNPVNGTPPPLCYLIGLGAFQFDNHPLAITSFNYSLPTDVDYIPAGNAQYIAGINQALTGSNPTPRQGSQIAAGGLTPPARFNTIPTGTVNPTYVPTKISLSISAVPIVSRNDISNRFSLKDYGSGKLLQGSRNNNGTGIW